MDAVFLGRLPFSLPPDDARTVGDVFGAPLIVGYTVFAYRVFKGKVGPGDAGY